MYAPRAGHTPCQSVAARWQTINLGKDLRGCGRGSAGLLHVEHIDPHEVAQVFGRIKSEHGSIHVFTSKGALEPEGRLLIIDLPENINRMLKMMMH